MIYFGLNTARFEDKSRLPNKRNFNVVSATTTLDESRGGERSLNPVYYLATAGPADIQKEMVEAVNESSFHRTNGLNVATPAQYVTAPGRVKAHTNAMLHSVYPHVGNGYRIDFGVDIAVHQAGFSEYESINNQRGHWMGKDAAESKWDQYKDLPSRKIRNRREWIQYKVRQRKYYPTAAKECAKRLAKAANDMLLAKAASK